MPITGSTQDSIAHDPAFQRAHDQLVADKSIQFDFPVFDPPKTPEWIKAVARFFEWLSPAFQYIFWGAVILVAGLFLWMLIRHMQGASFRWPWQKKTVETDEDDWQPDAAQARALLSEAEALAADGRFAEAARLLLHRSVEDIEQRRPGFLKPSVTAREIASAQAVPTPARTAFSAIARVVETSAFGSASVTAAAWTECRNAYGEFALAGTWRG